MCGKNHTHDSSRNHWQFPHIFGFYHTHEGSGNPAGGCIFTLSVTYWLHLFDFSPLCFFFQVSHQIACIRRDIVTLIAFVWLFSTVRLQMSPQIACLRRGIVALIAFVWLFSTVCFQMLPQIACTRRGITTLFTFAFWFNDIVCHLSFLAPLCGDLIANLFRDNQSHPIPSSPIRL